MTGVNKVILVGNLGDNPEIRTLTDGRKMVTCRLATNESWRDKATGERREKVEWHTVVIFNDGLARVAEQYLKKGSKIYIEGQLQTRKWQDKQGADRYTTEVVLTGFGGKLVMLDSTGSGRPPAGTADDYSGPGTDAPPPQGTAGDMDDEIPF